MHLWGIEKEFQSWALYDILGDLLLVVAMLRWLLQVSVHVVLTPHVASATPHVVVVFAVFLERFVADPLGNNRWFSCSKATNFPCRPCSSEKTA